jgi:hypothetical protein
MRTSPSNRSILKLRLLILSCGELGKQTMQFVNEYTTSKKYVPSDPMIAVGVCMQLRLYVELLTACQLNVEQSKDCRANRFERILLCHGACKIERLVIMRNGYARRVETDVSFAVRQTRSSCSRS